jgi:hypothetical protein
MAGPSMTFVVSTVPSRLMLKAKFTRPDTIATRAMGE